ncbi:beta-ketoacyl synthase N-terminal-like domain-containing protein [Buchnera aphidicola]|uniref:3-oxoacyl-[acyl-carrier-protein] synthase 1 n=1 Tax=Buchnera aphidicola subsp. Rhopalosiphum maidis TaxID=118109 RepID=A0A3G2I650_BUCRM|nr:beta-ketoacyl synthase N-terminal-like domain-containing protein [Buchnera aphidicola]AYN24418.1 beta-ketoacyl-[acyl-carrier-protein] synthase I [Buchnera aphidicola (Rhopalosiphum maidis)]
MKRVVITGFGIISSIGNNKKEVLNSLYNGISGITFSEEMKESGMRSQVWGNIKLKDKNYLKKNKTTRFMNDGSLYAFLSMEQAIKDANLKTKQYQKNPRIGLIVGSGGGSPKHHIIGIDAIRSNRGLNSVSPYIAIKAMNSGISACLSTLFKIYGVNYSISSACATSGHCIGNAFELIKFGKQDLIFAGGGEEVSWELACEFDAMKALSSHFNNTPIKSSRVYDVNRDGFVVSGGGGIVVIEELNCALSRSAHIYAEIIGYAATSDGKDMIVPSGEGAVRCMNLAKKENKISFIDYLNVHGTSTKIGDLIELDAIKKSFRYEKKPMISATKSMTGHALGVSGVHEIIYTLLMMKYNFIAPSINIEKIESSADNMNIVQKTFNTRIETAMSNSFGFGGTNVSLILKKY